MSNNMLIIKSLDNNRIEHFAAGHEGYKRQNRNPRGRFGPVLQPSTPTETPQLPPSSPLGANEWESGMAPAYQSPEQSSAGIPYGPGEITPELAPDTNAKSNLVKWQRILMNIDRTMMDYRRTHNIREPRRLALDRFYQRLINQRRIAQQKVSQLQASAPSYEQTSTVKPKSSILQWQNQNVTPDSVQRQIANREVQIQRLSREIEQLRQQQTPTTTPNQQNALQPATAIPPSPPQFKNVPSSPQTGGRFRNWLQSLRPGY